MKRILALLLAALLLPLFGAFGCAEDRPDTSQRLYYARTRLACKIFTDWETTNGVNQIGVVPENVRVVVHALNPSFALVTYEADHKTGYVKRVCLENPKTIDAATTPPYGVDFNHYLVTVGSKDAPVWSAPGGGETLITLHRGAKVSLIGFEEGYGKVIYHRQYGYIDSRLLTNVTPVYDIAETAGVDAPIASYTSFYKITTDESNLNRINNIEVACGKMNVFPIYAGADLDFNRDMGPYSARNGYLPAGVLAEGGLNLGYGGGTCQVSSTLYNVVLQLPGITVLQRRAHGDNGASYLPIGVDAAVGNSALNFRFRNDYPFPIRIDSSAQDGALTIAIYKAM